MLVYPIPIGFIQYIGVNDLLLKKTHKKNGNTVVSSLPWLDKLCLEGGCLWHLVVNDSC